MMRRKWSNKRVCRTEIIGNGVSGWTSRSQWVRGLLGFLIVCFCQSFAVSGWAQLLIPIPYSQQERAAQPNVFLGVAQPQSELENQQAGGVPSIVRKMPGGQALLKVVKPGTYILGPGDGLVLNIWGSVQALYELTVFADGKIIIPTVGSLYVNGISLKKAQLLVTDAVKSYYRNVMTSLSLTTLRVFEIQVVGEVERPGSYLATAVLRVSDVIQQAEGILLHSGSTRQVQLKRKGRVRPIDLFTYNKTGRQEDNPLVEDGDIILVPQRSAMLVSVNTATVDVTGGGGIKEVPVRRVLEFKPHERLSDLPAMLGGVDPWWDLRNATLVRTFNDGAPQEIRIPIDLDSLWIWKHQDDDHTLRGGDVLTIPTFESRVYVVGEVRNSGAFVHRPNRLARDYLALANGPTRRANLKRSYLERIDGSVIPLKDDTPIESGDTITVQETSFEGWRDILQVVSLVAIAFFYGVLGVNDL